MNCVLGPCLLRNTRKQTLSINKSVFYSFHSRPPNIRRFSNISRLGVRLMGEAKYLRKDNVPLGYQLIYRAPMQNYVAAATHATTFSALVIAGLAIYVAVYGKGELNAPLQLEIALKTDKQDIKFYAVMFVLMCLGMRYVVMRYPYRIYRKDKECIAILDSQIPFTKRRITFQQGQVTKITPRGFLPWKESWYMIHGEKVLLLEDYFKIPVELHNMLAAEKT